MSHQFPDIVKMIEDYGILKYRAGCTSDQSSATILETASHVKADLIAAITFIASVKREPLSDEQIDQIHGHAYIALRAQGFNGGMGGLTWDRASARAIEQAHGIGLVDKSPNLQGKSVDKIAEMHGSQWLPIESAPKDGECIQVKYEDGTIEDDVYWSDTRYCMLGAPQGSRGPGWVSTNAGNLPVDEVAYWMPPQVTATTASKGDGE